MYALLIGIGAFLGAWLGDIDEVVLGIVAGGFAGYMLGKNSTLANRIRELENRVDEAAFLRTADPGSRERPPAAAEPQPPTGSPAPDPTVTRPEAPARAARQTAVPGRQQAESPAAATAASKAEAPVPRPLPGADLFGKAWRLARRWITTGNVPVKVGVIVLFFGVSFLLKYAVERSILVIPIELRLLAVAAIAVTLLVVGWRLRDSHRVYGLSLQGGGIGVLYLTIFAAFRLYGLMPSLMAFLLLVVLTAAAGVLAVRQDAKALAVLGIIGGFMAPIAVSTGSGNHVALFSYYLLLNAGILGISWFRAWRELNVIGFVFTFGIGTLWGLDNYRPELYASTQPFLILYFLFYQAIAILFAHRQPVRLRGIVDGTILFGTPVISFALQERLVSDTEYGLAISAAAVGIFYVLVASWLYRRHRETLKLLVESYVALAVAFATITIPLALDARWTAAAWALEGAALTWVGVRQHGLLAKAAGAVLLFASGVSFFESGWNADAGLPILNGNALGGALIALSSLYAAFRLYKDLKPHPLQSLVSLALLAWGLSWWFGTGMRELIDRWPNDTGPLLLLFVSVSAIALAGGASRTAWTPALRATLGALPVFALFGLVYIVDLQHWLEGIGWLAWPLALLAHGYVMRKHDGALPRLENTWHFAGALLFVGGIAFEVKWRLWDAGLNDTWQDSAGLALLGAAAWAFVKSRERFAWPLQRYWNAYLAAGAALIALLLVTLTGLGLDRPGNPAPLPYIPLANPFDLVTAGGLILALRYLQVAVQTSDRVAEQQASFGRRALAVAAFVMTTIAVVRAVHHFAGVPWTDALMRSVSVQSSLSIYWGLLGFAGMVFGARRAHRKLWLLGTGMMALVVCKLFLIDLGNTGTVARIVSFLGVGALLLVVGYFAPAPPKAPAASPEST